MDWFTAVPKAPPPARSTRPSGSSSADEWYRRGRWAAAVSFQVFVSGFQISVARTPEDCVTPSEEVPPPEAITVPSGSEVSVWYERGKCIGAASCHAGLGTVMSMVAARLLTTRFGNSGSPHVPDLRILPGRYITAL